MKDKGVKVAVLALALIVGGGIVMSQYSLMERKRQTRTSQTGGMARTRVVRTMVAQLSVQDMNVFVTNAKVIMVDMAVSVVRYGRNNSYRAQKEKELEEYKEKLRNG